MKRLLVPAVLCLLGRPAFAEDPFLGQIKAIKCVGCRPGWVDIVVHDPIDVRDFEIAVKDVDYYKVVSPLPGKKIHDKDGACFYWFDAPKGSQPAAKPKRAAPPKPAPAAAAPSDTAVPAAAPKDSSASADSSGAASAASHAFPAAATDSILVPPPALAEPEGPPPTPSRCIPYVRQAATGTPAKAEK